MGQFENHKPASALDGQGYHGNGSVAELGGDKPVELDGSEYRGNGQPTVASMVSTPQIGLSHTSEHNAQVERGPLSGPLPSASELYPSPQLRGM